MGRRTFFWFLKRFSIAADADARVAGDRESEVVREPTAISSSSSPSRERRKKMSSSGSLLKLLFTSPNDFRTLLQFKLFYESKRDLTALHEHPTSGWDRRTMRRCWDFLDMTSRSFSAVIKELDGDLARVVSLFLLPSGFLDPRAAPAHLIQRSSNKNANHHSILKFTRFACFTSY